MISTQMNRMELFGSECTLGLFVLLLTRYSGDYFEEIKKISERESQLVCKEPSHHWCVHSVTANGAEYRQHAKVESVPWEL